MTGPILSYDPTRTDNAQLMLDVRALGYVTDDMTVLDPTYGLGRFWKLWRPPGIVASDLDPRRDVTVMDFTHLPLADRSFDVVAFDPPYKFNGTGGSHVSDDDYGVADSLSANDRMRLIMAGLDECRRVARERVLVKCQDQVVSGRKRWQSWEIALDMETSGWRLEDRLEVANYRPQPEGRRQVHSRQTTSSLLVFRRR